MDQNVYEQKFKIRSYEIGLDQKVTVDAYVKIIQEASTQHAIALNLSFWDLTSENLSWVLLKKDFVFYKFPAQNEEITVVTYPAKINAFFALRDYKVYDANHNLITSAASKWSLINTEKRKIARIPKRIQEIKISQVDVLGEPDFKLQKLEDYQYCKQFEIQSFDLDWNGHLNNGELVKYVINTCNIYCQDLKIDQLQIDFKSEVKVNEIIEVKLAKQNNWILCQVENVINTKIVAFIRIFT